jgi:hypothetical protein
LQATSRTENAASSTAYSRCFRARTLSWCGYYKRTCVTQVAIVEPAPVEPPGEPDLLSQNLLSQNLLSQKPVEPEPVEPLRRIKHLSSPWPGCRSVLREKQWEIGCHSDRRARRAGGLCQSSGSCQACPVAQNASVLDAHRRAESTSQQLGLARQQLEVSREASSGRRWNDAALERSVWAILKAGGSLVRAESLCLRRRRCTYWSTAVCSQKTAVLQWRRQHNFFHAQDVSLMMKPFGRTVEAITAPPTPITVDEAEVRRRQPRGPRVRRAVRSPTRRC